MRRSSADSSGCSAEVTKTANRILNVSPSSQLHPPRRATARIHLHLTVFCLLITTDLAFSQNPLTSFGPCVNRPLDFLPRGLAVRHHAGEPEPRIAVLAQDRPMLQFLALRKGATLVLQEALELRSAQEVVLPLDGADGDPEFVTLAADGSTVTTLTRKGSAYEETAIPVDGHPQRIAIADINNDGKKDILMFGKSMAGVATLLGKGGGQFVRGPILFPEISVSGLCTADLNGDGITDVLLLNWLSNQMVVLYGISRAIFSEQITVDLPGEPAELALSLPTKRQAFIVAVTLPGQDRIAVLTGNSAGEFEVAGSVQCPGSPAGVILTDLNGDQIPDIVSSTEKGIIVALGISPPDFSAPVPFGIGSASSSWAVSDIDGDGMPDLIVADHVTRRLSVVANARHSGRMKWPDEYAVGGSPQGLCAADVDGDGRIDIAVVNARSSTISFLLNRGEGEMDGQQALGIPESPASIIVASSGAGTGRTLVTSHPAADRIGIIDLAGDVSRSESFTVPTGPGPHALFARGDTSAQSLEILVRYRNPRDASVSLSLFEKISGRQFLERSLKTHLPNKITALTVSDFSNDRSYDLVYVTKDPATRQSTVSLARGSAGFGFGGITSLFSYPDSSSYTRGILPVEADGDRFRDFMLVLAPPRSALALALDRGSGLYSDSLVWLENLQPRNDDAIIVKDVDGDGYNDITVLDASQKEVVVLYGSSRGTFEPPRVITEAVGVSAIAVAPLRRRGVEDLILSHEDRGTVSIVFAPFGRKSAR